MSLYEARLNSKEEVEEVEVEVLLTDEQRDRVKKLIGLILASKVPITYGEAVRDVANDKRLAWKRRYARDIVDAFEGVERGSSALIVDRNGYYGKMAPVAAHRAWLMARGWAPDECPTRAPSKRHRRYSFFV